MERFHFNYNNERNKQPTNKRDTRSCCTRADQPQPYQFTFFCQIQIHIPFNCVAMDGAATRRLRGALSVIPLSFVYVAMMSSYLTTYSIYIWIQEVNHDHLYFSFISPVSDSHYARDPCLGSKFHLSMMDIHWHAVFFATGFTTVSLGLLIGCSSKFSLRHFSFSSSLWKIYW